MKESLLASRATKGSLLKSFSGYTVLLRNRPFMIHTCLKAVGLGVLFAYISSSPFIMQTHYGLSQTQYGIIVGVNALCMAAGSMMSLRFRPFKKAAFIGASLASAGIVAQAIALYTVHNLWVYDAIIVVILFALGMIMATSNTLAMNEGRARSGDASAVLGISGYIVGATVSPLVGLGDILHSTALVNLALVAALMVFAFATRRLAPDLEQ